MPSWEATARSSFGKKSLVNYDEDAFDHLTTGSGYTWVAVLAVARQLPSEDLNCFFGNLKNGGVYEGFWGGLNDDNTLWMGLCNGVTFDRGNKDNPKVVGPQLAEDRFYAIAGRMVRARARCRWNYSSAIRRRSRPRRFP